MYPSEISQRAQVSAAPSKISLFAFPLPGEEFKLADSFIASYAVRTPDWGPIGYVVYKRTYARRLSGQLSEEWYQTVRRVVEGVYKIQQRHCYYNHLPWDADKAQRSARNMYERLFSFKFTPPGRGLWIMGSDHVEKNGSAALNNCAFVSTVDIAKDFTDPFAFLMDMSMLGVGVGSDTRGAGTRPIGRPLPYCKEYTIPDSREGWVEALRRTLNSYTSRDQDERRLPHFDYSQIRPAGSPIKGFGGTAEGPEPLRTLLEEDIPKILDPLFGQTITSSAIVDIFNVIGKCVVAGNVRRTAEIMFGEPDDESFLDLKNPEKYPEEMKSHRWASNNSVLAVEGMDYSSAAARIVKSGEPGFIWLHNIQQRKRMKDPEGYYDMLAMGSNPCVEQSLENYELCTLVETYPAHHDSYEDYLETLKMAYLYAKTVTLVPTHNAQTNEVMRRNMRIGLSQSGIVQNFAKVGRREHFKWCDDGYDFVQKLDEKYARWLAVRRSIKTTSVKPSGSVSKLCGATSGIHYPPAEYYIQRIRFSKESPILNRLIKNGYRHEQCVYSKGSIVVEFPCHTENFIKSESDVSLWEQFENAAQMQHYWADNQVSCTVKFDQSAPGIQDTITSALELYETRLKGISLLPHEHGYDQPPWEPITKEEYECRMKEVTPVTSLSDVQAEVLERFCDGDQCTI